ncbi:MAG TPA: COX15/CtaA family protein [Beijerinckiaceae bacterium]|nr:COX15/CtaA family protein [Methylobacteriaceae bacterium]HPG04575.1 COX15/CtaA family protein [Rhodoblastus sp.]HRY04905.1 COX15/CtaA family protein [Beijerinckiaceae bacterium]
MTDWINFPAAATGAGRAASAPDRAGVANWLWFVAALVFAMVVVGGATRLTESGLSITEWKPVTGVIPPLSYADWVAAFEKYKQIPQYKELFPDMDLARFQTIFLWEWSHRLLGRLIGIVFALGLVWFWLRGALTSRLKWQLSGVLALGALQGAVGWWMVASGLVNRVEVAQERLAIHLLLASLTFAALIWIAGGLRAPRRAEMASTTAKVFAVLLALATLKQIFLGALVAGLRAGLTYNTWPLMDGRFIPPVEQLFKNDPWWMNFFDNITTVQFDHRMAAYAVLALALLNAIFARQTGVARRGWAIVLLVLCQVGLGIATLLYSVPLPVALAHQAFAMIVLGMVIVNARAAFPARA